MASKPVKYTLLLILILGILGYAQDVTMRVISDDVLAVITIWQEARGEAFEGKVAVGEVIRNRMKTKTNSDGTVAGTVLAPLQFSGFNAKDPSRVASFKLDDQDPKYQSCLKAWEFSKTSNLVKGATHYLNPVAVVQLGYKIPSWANPEKRLVTIGRHEFYVE